MNTSFLNFLLVAAFIALLPGAGRAAPNKAGDTFPDLAKFQLEGKLPDPLAGKVVLVDFWASGCAPCKASFPAMTELHKRFAERGLVIVAVNVDDQRGAMESFLKKNPAPFAVVRDAAQKLVAATDVATMPTSFLLDREGRVRFLHHGFKGEETLKQYAKEIEELLAPAAK